MNARVRSYVSLYGMHVIVHFAVQNCADAGFDPKPIDIIDCMGMQSDEQLGRDLHMFHVLRQLPKRRHLL
jgi:hypothetical protein